MLGILMAVLLQSTTTTINGGLESPPGLPAPSTARVVLLPLEYAKLFNAQAQIRLDNYWEDFKPQFARQKELFLQFMPLAYSYALESVLSQMRRDSKVNMASLVKTAPQGQFEFHGVTPGEYKLVATASVRGRDYVWTETLQVGSAPIFLQMKTHVP